jgi:hypothetical protein
MKEKELHPGQLYLSCKIKINFFSLLFIYLFFEVTIVRYIVFMIYACLFSQKLKSKDVQICRSRGQQLLFWKELHVFTFTRDSKAKQRQTFQIPVHPMGNEFFAISYVK